MVWFGVVWRCVRRFFGAWPLATLTLPLIVARLMCERRYPSVDARIAVIRLPPDAHPGKSIEVSAPDGSRYRIVVPDGKSGGDEIRMRY